MHAGSNDSTPGYADTAATNMLFVFAIVAVATIGGFMFGYDSGVINGTQDGLQQAFSLTRFETGFNVAAILVGCAVGAFIAGRLADLIGRRTVMIIAAILFVVSALAAGGAPSSVVFIVARFIGGLGVGAASVLCPAYISEVTPARSRGRLASLQQVMIITGLTGAFLGNYFLAKAAGNSTAILWLGYPAWRWMFWAQLIPAAIFLIMLLIIPESPRFLVSRGRMPQAQKVLARIVGPAEAQRKAAEIAQSLAADHHRPKLSDLLDGAGRIRRIVWVGIGLAIFQQLVGINIVFYYGTVLWESVGFSENDSLLINVVSGVLSIGACIFTIFTVDRIGRKPLLIIGSVGMAVTLGLVAGAFATGSLVNGILRLSHPAGVLALISANLYVIFFNASWGPIMWVMLGEMFPNQIRGSGLAVAGFAQWMANYAISVSFPILAASVGLVITYGFYALSALVSFFFVRAMVHETRGVELEHMRG
ncbi:MAG TPA: sugar porter family MFS transporter [Steroidobacteraceae bacterium]|nr:sugar porter family MFS transporter [Steroidobacteraceae bacterium]